MCSCASLLIHMKLGLAIVHLCCSYKVVLREDVFGRGLKLPVLSREEVALVRAAGIACEQCLCKLADHGASICHRISARQVGCLVPVPTAAVWTSLLPEQVDYYLALGCQQFVGNSVSVFSALLIMERWHAGRFATYYNGGNIPLEAFMPLYQ